MKMKFLSMKHLDIVKFLFIYIAFKLFSHGVESLLSYFGIHLEWNHILSWSFLLDSLLSAAALIFVALTVQMFSEKRALSVFLLCFIMTVSLLGFAAHLKMI